MAISNDSNSIRQVSAQPTVAFNQLETSTTPSSTVGNFEVASNGLPNQSRSADDRHTPHYATTVRIRHRKVVYGVALALGGAVCFVGTTFCVRRSLRSIRKFYAPFFVSYFMTSWTILFYPVYVVVRSAASKGNVSLRDIVRCAALTLVWTLATYLFARGASNIDSSSDVTALFGCHGSFVYIMSWIVLQQQFVSSRIMAFIASMTGVIMITYNKTEMTSQIWNCSILTVSTAAAAFYQVLVQLLFNASNSGQTSLCQSAVGIFHLATVWPLFLLLYYTGAETIDWPTVPWIDIAAASAFAIGVQVILMYGRLVTSAALVDSCLLLSVPLAVGVDILFQDSSGYVVPAHDAVQIAAYLLIAVSHAVTALPPDWTDHVARLLCLRSRDPGDATLRTTATTGAAAANSATTAASVYQRVRRTTMNTYT